MSVTTWVQPYYDCGNDRYTAALLARPELRGVMQDAQITNNEKIGDILEAVAGLGWITMQPERYLCSPQPHDLPDLGYLQWEVNLILLDIFAPWVRRRTRTGG